MMVKAKGTFSGNAEGRGWEDFWWNGFSEAIKFLSDADMVLDVILDECIPDATNVSEEVLISIKLRFYF